MTWSPFFTEVTPGPTSTTTPAPSWPRIAGNSPSGIGARQRELVGVADAGRLDLDQHLAGLRAFELHGGDFERLAGRDCDCRAYVHV